METLKNQFYNSTNDPVAKARLLSVSTTEIGLRFGANTVEENRCICGASVYRNGTHGLSCRKSGRRIPRHQAANETLHCALVSGGVPSILEPEGVCREDAKRPDGITLIPWEGGRFLLWDFTSCDTLAHSHQVRAVRGAGEVANYAEEQKCRKYATLTPSYVSLRSASNNSGHGVTLPKISFARFEQESVRRQESRGQHPFSFRDWH